MRRRGLNRGGVRISVNTLHQQLHNRKTLNRSFFQFFILKRVPQLHWRVPLTGGWHPRRLLNHLTTPFAKAGLPSAPAPRDGSHSPFHSKCPGPCLYPRARRLACEEFPQVNIHPQSFVLLLCNGCFWAGSFLCRLSRLIDSPLSAVKTLNWPNLRKWILK